MNNLENLTSERIQQYLNLVEAEGIDAVPTIYSALNDMGFGYAGWAYGVSTGDTVTGQGALDFMIATRKEHDLPVMNIFEINNVRIEMLKGYLLALQVNAAANGFTNEDVKFYDIKAFHETAFKTNNLSLDY